MLKRFLIILLPTLIFGIGNTNVSANEDYPAANFSPTVIYLDESYITADDKNSDNVSVADSKYPASNFSPKVLYLDKDTTLAKKRETSKPDSKYPAANFTPQVIYDDKSD